MQVLVKNTDKATVTKPVLRIVKRLRLRNPFRLSVTSFGFFPLPLDVSDTGLVTAAVSRKRGPRYRDRLTSILLVALCFLFVFTYGCGPKHFIKTKTEVSRIKKIAVLPFENFTQDDYAGEKIRRIVITELLVKGIDVIEPGEVTRHLKELKVKSLGSIKNTELQGIGKALGVDVIMMGAVELFGISRGISVTYPEVTINLRLIEASSGNIIWSVRHTSGGASFWTRHFGSEGISLSESADKVVKEAIGTLF